MIQMTLAQAASILKLNDIPNDVPFHGLSIDTRTLKPQQLFIALEGKQADGHAFLAEAHQKGAAAALVTRHIAGTPLPQLIVDDVVHALGQLTAHWRHQFALPIIAVTGSNGKTTLKNMIASILTARCHGNQQAVLATQGTLNNHLGLPLTLGRLNADHQYGVIEMGMNHFGEIEYLTKLTLPDVAVITNAAASHLEGVGDLNGVAKAKAEILLGLPKTGTAILNRDDAFFSFWREQIGSRTCLSFGFDSNAEVSATIKDSAQNNIHLQTPEGNIDIHLPLLGKHNILNALAAAASTLAIGTSLHAIKTGLENTAPAPGRLQVHTLANGVKIIDDTYNANPFSLQAAIATLVTFSGVRILVLGDMKELGHEAKTLHQLAGETIRQAGIEYLFTYGDLSANTTQSFGQGAYHFREQTQLLNALKPFLDKETTILIKGSRSMHLEKVVAALMQ